MRSTDRRRLLATAALLAPAAALPAIATLAAEAGPDAALLRLGARLRRLDHELHEMADAVDIPDAEDPFVREKVAAIPATIAAIGRLPAHTSAGLLVKARILHDELMIGSTGVGDAVAISLVADLERLSGRAAA